MRRFGYDEEVDRYLPRTDLPPPPDPNPLFKWQPLSPSSSSVPDLHGFDRKRFNRLVRDEGTLTFRYHAEGKGWLWSHLNLQYGRDAPLSQRRPAYPNSFEVTGIEHEDPSHWIPRELAFSHRLRELRPDLKLYIDIQSESNPDLSCNEAAINRMTPRPTQYQLQQMDTL